MSRVSDAEIEKVVREIKDRDGICSPEAFVNAARDEKSPIHGCFDWDEHANSERWLLHRARQIIGRVKVIENEVETPAFVHVTIVEDENRRQGYMPLEDVMDDDDLRAQVFAEARAGLRGWKNRLIAFKQASAAVRLIDQAVENLEDDEE